MRNRVLVAAVITILLEVVVVGGTIAAGFALHGDTRLDVPAYWLLLAAGGSAGLAMFWPVPAFILALAATTTYAALGYPMDSPMFLGLIATLVAAPRPERPWRTAGMGAVTVATLSIRSLVASGAGSLNVGTAAEAGWVCAGLLVGHAIAAHRAYMAAIEDQARHAEETREAEAQRRVAEERLRIARELHDVVSHSISMINVQAGMGAHVIDGQPEQARAALLAIKKASKETMRELRGILQLLRDVDEAEPRLPAPGLGQLDTLVDATNQAGLTTQVVTSGTKQPLSPALDLTAYRIVQESLSNALRYAGPACVTVHIGYDAHHVTIEVTDDGQGTPSPSIGSGLGIEGMRERALAVGGELQAGPLSGGGFRVLARLPLAGAQ